MKPNNPPDAFTIAHSARTALSKEGIEFYDTTDLDWHLLEFCNPIYHNHYINLKIVAIPSRNCETEIYVNHVGGINILSVSPNGTCVGGVAKDRVRINKDKSSITIECTYFSGDAKVLIGTSKHGKGRYQGSGSLQFVFKEISISPPVKTDGDKLVIVDVGAAGGLSPVWTPFLADLHCVFVEPSPTEAAALREQVRTYSSAQVIEAALADRTGPAKLNVTRFPCCTSLRVPNMQILKNYSVCECFDVIDTLDVHCTRYDEILDAPHPDMIKIDVQGCEYEVLEGFGEHMNTTIAVELESHLYPIYEGQKLVHDIISLLDKHGLHLNWLSPQMSFDDDFLEVNLFFTRAKGVAPSELWKLDLIKRALGLDRFHPTGQWLAQLFPR
jgi:FkbM family methyltransferase